MHKLGGWNRESPGHSRYFVKKWHGKSVKQENTGPNDKKIKAEAALRWLSCVANAFLFIVWWDIDWEGEIANVGVGTAVLIS